MLLYYHSWMFYNHFIATLYHFLGLTYWHSALCQLLYFAFFYFAENQYQTESKRSETFWRFFWTRRQPMGRRGTWGGGAPRGAQPTRARQEAQARSGGLCPPRVPPGPPLCSINTPIKTLGESTKYSSSHRRVQNHRIQSRHHLGWGSPSPLVPLRWCVSSSL